MSHNVAITGNAQNMRVRAVKALLDFRLPRAQGLARMSLPSPG